jgi:hypothetical protein
MGEILVIAGIIVLAFFSGRSTLRSIKAELRGEATCAGCSKCGEVRCCSCMKQMEELRKLKKEKKDVRIQ